MSDRWQQLTALFEAALEKPEQERDVWLESACEDPDLLQEVRDMLAAHGSESDVLDQPAQVYAADLLQEQTDFDSEGLLLGRYRLLEEVGVGGMGKVYLGERADGQFEQRVAIKILRAALASGHFEKRFLNERQILASLNHPNVGKILDGGITESGAPFFVMEFIEGSPITQYCAEHGLAVERRLQLFLEVCSAVAHAHQRLVVHRDLKPSNILVTPRGRVKLLDFGIAKVLESDLEEGSEVQTMTGLHLMTPEYASPEQVRGDPISIASDVYQLGILLFEVLTEQRPYELHSRAITEIARVVLETEAPRPGSLVKLQSDLDAITMKALRKEPSERYPSVDHLAADLTRYLEGRPVSAHKGSTSYRVKKYVKRHRWAIAGLTLFLIAVSGYAITITVEQRKTERERDRAERYAEFVTDLFASPDPFAGTARIDQRDITVQEFLDQASKRIGNELRDDPELQRELLVTIGGVYDNLGATDKARPLWNQALAVSENEYGLASEQTIEVLRKLAWVADNEAESDSLYRLLLDLAEKVEPSGGQSTGEILAAYGNHLETRGKLEEADSILVLASDLKNWRQTENGEPAPGVRLFRARVQADMGNYDVADSLIQLGLESDIREYGARHPQTAVMMHQAAAIAEMKGDLDRAERLKREVLSIWTERLGANHPYTLVALNNLAVLQQTKGDFDAAEETMREVVSRTTKSLGENDVQTADALQNLGAFLTKRGKYSEAEPLLFKAHGIYQARIPDNYKVAYPLLSLTQLYFETGDYDKAEQSSREAMGQIERTLSAKNPLFMVAKSRHGASLMRLGNYGQAREELADAIAALEATGGYAQYLSEAREWMSQLPDSGSE